MVGSQYDLETGTHICYHCGKAAYQSATYITAEGPGLSWQRLLDMVCIECWSTSRPNAAAQPEISNSEWRHMCKAEWLERKVAVTGHTERSVRRMSSKRVAKSIEARHPGEHMAAFRKRRLALSQEVATTITEGIVQLSAEDRDNI